jgi:hypothetical protein
LGRRGSAAPRFVTRKTAVLPHHPTRRGDVAARRNRVRCGRSAGACVPRASARRGVARGGRGLLRGHVLACGPTAAVLRMRALACGPTAARLRAAALAYAPPAAAARLPTAARSAAALRPSASGAALDPHAPAVCLRRRARPRPLRRPRPVAAPTYGALWPASLPPGGSTPSAPAPAAQAFSPSRGAWGGGAGHPGSRQTAARKPSTNLRVPAAPRVPAGPVTRSRRGLPARGRVPTAAPFAPATAS